jgi:hypothetical protein
LYFFALILLPFILNKLLKYRLGSTGGLTDPVSVITCINTFSTVNGLPTVSSFMNNDTIEVRLGVRMMHDLPLAVDLKIAYLDSGGNGRIGTVDGAKVEWKSGIGKVRIAHVPGGICQSNFTCRAWVTIAYYAQPSLPWRNRKSTDVQNRLRKWLINQQNKIK